MKALVIEDEQPAADRLIRMIREIHPDVIILEVLPSVKAAVDWFKKHVQPDLVFMDINLADGSSFEIFKSVKVTCPIIFITAFDEYAIEAFKVNSIDYILKPVKKEHLQQALNKYAERKSPPDLETLVSMLSGAKKDFQKRFVIRFGDTIRMIDVKDIAFFYTENKANYLCTHHELRYPVDVNLDEIEKLTDPAEFFRINRQVIVNISAIEKMLAWSKSRVKLVLKPSCDLETIVSTDRSPHFKEWLTGKKE